MEVRMWPTQVRAVRATQTGGNSCLVFSDDGNELWLCFDADNLHVVRYLQGSVSVLKSLLGIEEPQS